MIESSTRIAAQQPFLPLLQMLNAAYQAFSFYDQRHLRTLGLTASQADVLFTLGNQAPMSFKDIGTKTLITKGTLTGVVDRLEERGLVRRQFSSEDRRSIRVALTEAGSALFEAAHPKHIAHLEQRFKRLETAEIEAITLSLRQLKEVFQ
jgi:DNA-binding MarR family transcriptional regulator